MRSMISIVSVALSFFADCSRDQWMLSIALFACRSKQESGLSSLILNVGIGCCASPELLVKAGANPSLFFNKSGCPICKVLLKL